uniref:Putative secreted peptide n=1 Tax=Anopheles braziliensis TaxID=58242 RepID=A0A2M3ZST4_9DIPT
MVAVVIVVIRSASLAIGIHSISGQPVTTQNTESARTLGGTGTRRRRLNCLRPVLLASDPPRSPYEDAGTGNTSKDPRFSRATHKLTWNGR